MVTVDEVSNWDDLTQEEKDKLVGDVEALSSKGWNGLQTSNKEALLKHAINEANSIYTGRVSHTPIIDGDSEIFILNLAAHKWELAEGGEAQSQSSTGGSVNYNTVTGDVQNYLSLTRFGITCLEHIRSRTGIGLVRTY